jgi:23S rRNA pseudouridine2605 synthase
MPENSDNDNSGERIAKVMARAGLASRRAAEAWIAAGRVSVNGAVISSPALNVKPSDRIVVDGQPLPGRARTRLFRYHKPRGLVTTHADPQGRPTIFRALPKRLPRVISVGRLDINSEGLLLLTNDGGLARALELPATGWLRRYRVRAHGRVTQEALDRLRDGTTVAGIHYGPIEATLDREQGANVWLTIGLREGKNREVRKVLEQLGLTVNRLIRVAYGPFELGDLDDTAVEEVQTEDLRKALGPDIAAQASADFESPLEFEAPSPRHSGTGRRPEPGIQRGHAQPPLDGAPLRGSRNDRKKKQRRDRTGGPRPKYPRPRS